MIKIIQILKNHKWAIVFAFLTAIIVAYPQVWLRYDQKEVYYGIELIGASDDEDAWMSRVREIQDGHPSLSCVYFKDGKNDPYLFQPLGSIMIAGLGKTLSFDLNDTILFSRFSFVFIVFLIIYGFLLSFAKDKLAALVSPSVLFLASSLLSRQGLWQLLRGNSPQKSFLLLTRPVNPLMTFFFFFGFILFFWLFLDSSNRFSARRRRIFGIICVLFLGLSFYDYLFTWTFLYVFCGVLGSIFLLQRNWPNFKKVAAVLLGASFIAIPYLINFYKVNIFPTYQEVTQRAGLIDNRLPVLGFLVPFLFVVFLIFFPKKWREQYYFALALLITPFIVLNQQLITGKTLITAHYHWYFHTPLAIIFLLTIFFLRIPQVRKIRITAAVLLIVVSFYSGILTQISSYSANKEKITTEQRYGQVLGWLNKNAGKDEVVFSNNELAHLIVIYTPFNVFYHSSARYCLASPRDRLLNAIFLYYRLDGVEKDQAAEIFLRDKAEISKSIYGLYYRETTGKYEGIPDEIILEFVKKYQDSFSLSTNDFLDDLWTEYEVKYLVWDKSQNPRWRLDQYPFLKKAAEMGDFEIYQKD